MQQSGNQSAGIRWQHCGHPPGRATFKITPTKEFPGGPVVGLHPSTSGYLDLIPSQGTKILHAVWCSLNKYNIQTILYIIYGIICM